MFNIIAYLLIFSCVIAETILCSPGCSSCLTNYTCLFECSGNYENDTSCLHCKPVKDNIAYIPNGLECVENSMVIEKTGWIPDTIELLSTNATISFGLNENIGVDYGPCRHSQKYRIGKWFYFDQSTVSLQYVVFTLSKKTVSDAIVTIDVSDSNKNSSKVNCYAQSILDSSTQQNRLKIPVQQSGQNFLAIFISLEGYNSVSLDLNVSEVNGDTEDEFLIIDQTTADLLSSQFEQPIVYSFPFQTKGIYAFPTCTPSKLMKCILFRINFSGNYYLRIDTTISKRKVYLEEYSSTTLEDGSFERNCTNLWVGESFLTYTNEKTYGIQVKLKPSETERYFALMTEENVNTLDVSITALCPNDCNFGEGNGNCSTLKGGCVCDDRFTGADCHKKCYYNGQWQVDFHDNLCYFGSKNCNDKCQCNSGYTLINNVCVSFGCAAGALIKDEQCFTKSEGCNTNCYCDANYDWTATSDKKCKSTLCGNGIIDELYDMRGFIRKEECDGGVNCDLYCKCIDGYESDPENPTSCKQKTNTTLVVAVSTGASVLFIFLIVLIAILIVVIVTSKSRNRDLGVYRTQQEPYHYYINGSKNLPPSEETKYIIDPIELDFGNSNNSTEIYETRFERMSVKNYSRNKWMMVIFHTPNNQKFVFHFEPQVIFVRPMSYQKEVVCFMTLHCTTKIRDMKIPYTVWFSKSKSTLESIAELLKDKTFDDWNQDDQIMMDKLCKNVIKHYHYSLVVKTDAASSTFLDMDELNMSEKPIAEGANGRVFIGSYRSVPVAIKQFRWENLTDEEMKELKQEVINECEIMKKLRNPFIANYMGSVTYVSQVSMVIQFFVLGSLGEYLRKDKEDYVKLPYKLKIRMLFDTARGMQFLHENRIMHLDLKPDNLLVNSLYTDSACCIKITDFGTSRFTKKTNKSGDKGLGTPIYASPESYHDEYTFAGDVYSFAITTWELFYQEEPYKEFKSLFEIKEYVESGKRLGFDDTIPNDLKSLVEGCWKHNKEDRLKFSEICSGLVFLKQDGLFEKDLDGDTSGVIENIIATRTKRMRRQLNEE